jgi:glycosyltransferase involved in cell wall biosynthesis
MSERRDRLLRGAPLRFVFNGRLEPMKGADDLVPVADALKQRGIDFTLDVFGTGTLKDQISAGISARKLGDVVRLHDPVDFETELVPFLRKNADVFLCCHKQSDPSCTYIENMGCGLAVMGYDNRMWAKLSEMSGAGWTGRMGQIDAFADLAESVNADRLEMANRCDRALSFAKAHSFEAESRKRMDHLVSMLSDPVPT